MSGIQQMFDIAYGEDPDTLEEDFYFIFLGSLGKEIGEFIRDNDISIDEAGMALFINVIDAARSLEDE